MSDLTVVILTYNEEKNIYDCIQSVKNIAKKIYVIDSYSTDNTVKIANENGATVLQHIFVNQSKQYQWAMENIQICTKWVFRIDADERLTDEAREELEEALLIHENDDINGIVLRFEVVFLGKALKHGGAYMSKMSVYRHGFALIEDKEMDEHFYLLSGKAINLKSDLKHCDYKDVSSWIEKHNKYSSREAESYFKETEKDHKGLDAQALKKQTKKNGYYKAPMFLRVWLYYLYRLIVKGAWLDGREGRIYAYLQAYWYRYLVDVKILEQKIEMSGEKL